MAAAVTAHTSAGSHGVSVIAEPGAKFSCINCSACGSAWVGPSSPVFNPAWPHTSIMGRLGPGSISLRAWLPMA